MNAGRYETVGDLDRALDARARPPRLVAPRLGGFGAVQSAPQNTQQNAPGGFLGVLALIAVGAGLAYVIMKKDGVGDGADAEGDDEDEAAFPALAPASPTTQNVVVQPAVAPVVLPSAPIANPAPVVAVVAAAPAKRRRRMKNPKAPVVALAPTVVTVTTGASTA